MEIMWQWLCFMIGFVYTSAVGNVFLENPMSITVTLGGDVHFWCKTAEQFACYNMHWVFSNSKTEGDPFGTIGTCRTPSKNWNIAASERITQSFHDGRFGLHISNVSYNHSGRYACWVAKSVAGEPLISEYSAVAFLTVLSPVPTPLCRYTPQVASVGDEVWLTCEVPRDAYMETIKLTWVYDSLSPVRGVQVDRGETFSKPHTLLDSDNYKIFTCVAGADNTNGPNCTLSLLQIPTTVDVIPVFGEDETTFVCNASAVPPVTHYHWSVQEMDSSTREWRDVQLSNSQNRGTTFVLAAGSDTGLIGRRLSTTCTASNSIGLTKSSAPVTTLQCGSGATVTELTRCEDLSETTPTMVTEESTRSVGTGGPQGTGDGIGIYVWIIVAAVIFLVVVAIVCCIFLVRYRRTTKSKNTSTNNGHLGMGVAYSTTMGSVDVRSHTGASESNARMMEAEVVLTASNSSLHQLDTRLDEVKAGNTSFRVGAPSMSDGLRDGETYASIGDSHQTQGASQSELRHSAGDRRSGPHKSSHGDYDTIGPDVFQPSGSFDGTAGRNPSEVDPSDSTYASVGSDQQPNDEVRLPPELGTRPCEYESVDLNISKVQTSVRDSSSLKKVCVVSPTCHLKDGGDNQVVYAMPDKQRKPNMASGAVTNSKPVQEPPGIVYAKPDKKQKKSVEKYVKKSTNIDNTSKIKSSPQNIPEGLYAMPDKTQNRQAITSLVNSQDAKDDNKTAIPESELPSNIHELALTRSNSITPKKPHRTASSKVAGSQMLRDSLKRQNDSAGGMYRSYSRSSSTEMDKLEASTPSADPAESNTARNLDTSSTIPIYAVLEKESK